MSLSTLPKPQVSGLAALRQRRPPSSLTGMQPQGSGAVGPTQSLTGTQDRTKRLGNMYDRLIMDDNPAADQAERTTLTELGNQRAERQAEFGQEAAQMGLKPGDVGYKQAQSRAMSPLNSQGSSILSGLASQRMAAHRQNINDAAAFTQGQQSFEESGRRFDLNRSDNREDMQTRNMFDLLGMSDLLSEGQAGAVKGALGGSLGLGGDQWNAKDPDQFTRAVQEQAAFYKATRPGITDEEALALAQKDVGTMNPAQFFGLAADAQYTGAPGAGGQGGGPSGWDVFQDGMATMNPAANFAARGTGHFLGEAGRGFRDIGRGDILGGTGRVLAAPVRGATHGVMDTGRRIGRTAKRAWDLIT